MMVPLRAGSPFQEILNHCPRRVMYRTVTVTGRVTEETRVRGRINPDGIKPAPGYQHQSSKGSGNDGS